MPFATTTAPTTEDLGLDEVERVLLRVEFEAIVAAGYRPADDARIPRPPRTRQATIAATAPQRPRSVSVDGGGLRACAYAHEQRSTQARERGPPAPSP
jgi:hypothetical protein